MFDFSGYRHPGAVITMAVRWYIRYKLSLRDITELLIERGVNVSHESIREWVLKFGPEIANTLDQKRRGIGFRWHVDETYMKVSGVWKYVYRAVDQDMEPIDVYASETRDKKAAKIFFDKCLAVTGKPPESVRSDSHNGYDQVKDIFPKARHHKVKCLNNKAESSHVPIKQRYRVMRGFKSLASMIVFLEAFESLYRFFRKHRPKNREMRDEFAARLREFDALLQSNCALNQV